MRKVQTTAIFPNRIIAVLLAASCAWTACSKKPDPVPVSAKEDVETLFRKMVGKRSLTVKDPLYQKIIEMGPGIAPDLKRIAENRDIQWHYIAYWMLGQIKDKGSIPFLIAAVDSNDEWSQIHAVWGLDCLLGLGRYNKGSAGSEEIKSRYKNWWEKHKSEFPVIPSRGK